MNYNFSDIRIDLTKDERHAKIFMKHIREIIKAESTVI